MDGGSILKVDSQLLKNILLNLTKN
jgi:hypothetical protein